MTMRARLCRRTGLLGAVALLAAACASPQPPRQQAAAAPPPLPRVTPLPAVAAPAAVPAPVPQEAASPVAAREMEKTGEAAPEALALRTLEPVTPEAFLGLEAGMLMLRLGPPDFTRRDGPVQVWQYHSASCMADLFLYPHVNPQDGGSVHTLRHMEMRPRQGRDGADCPRELARRFRAG